MGMSVSLSTIYGFPVDLENDSEKVLNFIRNENPSLAEEMGGQELEIDQILDFINSLDSTTTPLENIFGGWSGAGEGSYVIGLNSNFLWTMYCVPFSEITSTVDVSVENDAMLQNLRSAMGFSGDEAKVDWYLCTSVD